MMKKNSSSSTPVPVPMMKRQRLLLEFFHKEGEQTPIASQDDEEEIDRKMNFSAEDNEFIDMNNSQNSCLSANSTSSSVAISLPKPKKIDFDSNSSCGDFTISAPKKKKKPHQQERFASSNGGSGVFVVNHASNNPTTKLCSYYSQEDGMDFLTPQDQPVIQLSHPNSPSPLKKRQRPNIVTRSYNHNIIEEEHDHIQDEVVHLTQDLDDMDVCPKFDKENKGATPVKKHTRPESYTVPRISKPLSNSTRLPEINVNPFAPSTSTSETKKRSRRPTFAINGLDSSNSYSRYLFEFVELDLIGTGSFSNVFKCMHRIDGCTYAIKKIKKHLRGNADKQRSLREVYALASLGHCPYIIRYFNAWIEDDLLYIQLEYCDGGSIASEKQPVDHSLDDIQLRTLLCHISQALYEIHIRNMVHMDIKPSNILQTSSNIYKIGDFGTVALADGTMDITEGDNRYLSRELLEGNRSFLQAGDIFALGATIYELALGYCLASHGDDWQRIRDGDLQNMRQCSNSFQHLIESMMHPDPLQRPSALDILQHETIFPIISNSKFMEAGLNL